MIDGFTMRLFDEQMNEYEELYNELWTEMYEIIHMYGGKNYTVCLDSVANKLFGYIEIEDNRLWIRCMDTDINRKYWDVMVEIMKTISDSSTISSGFYQELFPNKNASREGCGSEEIE